MRTKLLAVAGSCGVATTLLATAVVPPSFQSYPLNEQTAKLKLVEVAFRHGARTPLSKRPDLWERLGAKWDCCGQAYQAVPLEYVSTKGGAAVTTHAANTRQINHVYPGGCHMGQLTHTGQLQARDFGEWLRLRYIQHLQLLPPTYQEGMVMARTTPYQRTMGTLAGVLTGLLGAPRRNTAPVKAYISPEVDEILYADTRSCPHLEIFMNMAKDRAVELVQEDPDYEWVNAELDRLGFTKPAHHTPKDWFFADLHDVVTALASAGKPIPPGFTPRLVSALNRLATKEFAPTIAPSVNDSFGQPMLRLSMGVLLATLVEDMEAVAAQPTETGKKSAGPPSLPRMRLYSGHDSTIMPLLSALGCDTLTSWPPFLSNLVFELWQLPPAEGGHHVVKVLYNREELSLPHCPKGQYVTLDSFKNQVLMPFLLSAQDMREACKVPMGHEGSLPKVEGSSASSLVPGGSAE